MDKLKIMEVENAKNFGWEKRNRLHIEDGSILNIDRSLCAFLRSNLSVKKKQLSVLLQNR